MAHLWFGDLVTTAWWHDIWLNEAFASWMSAKVIAHWKPEWNTKISEQNTRLGAMTEDSLVSARKIRQPIESNDDIANAFDDITSSKGQIVINMFESWMGEDAFRRGVQHYVRQYSFRNATAGDFLDSLGSVGNQGISRPFSTFLNQPGVPLISVKLSCDPPQGPTLHLNQKRALPLGSTGSTNQTWQVPVCVRYGEGDSTHRECTLLTQAATEWKLPQAKSCPAYVLANAGGAGYYRVLYQGDLLGRLLADGGRRLTPAERVAALGDVQALASMGDMKIADALALVPQFAGDPVRQVVNSTIDITRRLRQHLVPAELFPNYARFVDKTYGARARRLGWKTAPGDDSDIRLLRASLVPLVAVWGEDRQLAAEARQLAERWLKDRNSVDPEIVEPALTTAASTGDRAFFNELETALAGTKDRQQRRYIFAALGSFRDPRIARSAMELLLNPEVDIRESTGLLFEPLSNPQTNNLPFEFVEKNYDALTKKTPAEDIFSIGGFFPR